MWSIAMLHLSSLSRGLHRGKATLVTLSGHRKANTWEGLNSRLCINCYYPTWYTTTASLGGQSPMSQHSHCPTELTATDPWAISWISKLAVFSLAQMCTSIHVFIPFTTEKQNEKKKKPNSKQPDPNLGIEKTGINREIWDLEGLRTLMEASTFWKVNANHWLLWCLCAS